NRAAKSVKARMLNLERKICMMNEDLFSSGKMLLNRLICRGSQGKIGGRPQPRPNRLNERSGRLNQREKAARSLSASLHWLKADCILLGRGGNFE
ncbi:MAG TPA: hypothetical protein PLW66_09365, partial [Saprospiraceae bacterium]|nr:hypothetical protein [Saprospiraceae bacterium]